MHAQAMVRFQDTPDENSVKIALSQPIADEPVVFEDPDEAADDPLAEELMMVPGVTSLYYMQELITVNKEPEAEWDEIRPKVKQIISEYTSPGF